MSLQPAEKFIPMTHAEVRSRMKQLQTAINPERLKRAAERLGVSVRALKAFGIGWDTVTSAWSFPMYDGSLDDKKRFRPCGFRLRKDDGRKLCIKGSRNGLFIPANLLESQEIPDVVTDQTEPLCLLLPEGPTDAAAAMDLGFRAVGRPFNSGGIEQSVRLFQALKPQEVVIVADRDPTKWHDDGTPFWPGIEGALTVAAKLRRFVRELRFMMPPAGFKDLRAWLPNCSPVDLMIATGSAPLVTDKWLQAAEARVSEKRKAERKPAA